MHLSVEQILSLQMSIVGSKKGLKKAICWKNNGGAFIVEKRWCLDGSI